MNNEYNNSNKFYATASDKDGKSYVIKVNSSFRTTAVKEAKAECKKKSLKYEGLYLVKQSEKSGSTLTKYYKERKKQ
jgi:hypothetical protein